MFARYLNAPLLLLLWQVAPLDFHRDHAGRVRISFGAGQGGFAFRDDPGYPAGASCLGDYPARAPYTDKLGYSSGGIGAEIWAHQRVRIHAAFGSVSDYSGERDGSFFAFQAALEEKHFGVGLGLAALGGVERTTQPSISARVGSLNGFSLRADYHQPQAVMGLIGGPRIGLGWNQGRSQKPRVLVGVATTPVPDSARRLGGFVELAVPLGFLNSGLSVDGFVSGRYRGNEVRQIYSLGLGAWIQP
jgi:hypothetical protein